MVQNNENGEGFFEALMKQIKDAESALKPNEELQVIIHIPGQRVWATHFSFVAPGLITVDGHDTDGDKAQVISHYTRLQALVKIHAEPLLAAKKKPIGFKK